MLKRFLNIKEFHFNSKIPIELKGACWTGGRILSPSFRDTMVWSTDLLDVPRNIASLRAFSLLGP
ncbi:hypothetical protein IC575_012412 [Cucumis melo]